MFQLLGHSLDDVHVVLAVSLVISNLVCASICIDDIKGMGLESNAWLYTSEYECRCLFMIHLCEDRIGNPLKQVADDYGMAKDVLYVQTKNLTAYKCQGNCTNIMCFNC